ncbi:MAG: ABC transporter permease [Bacteroidales bacterium]|nr:ABC transporter permease [Bacteroidales bacterium]
MKIAVVDADSSDFGKALVGDLTSRGYFNFIIMGSDAEARHSILDGKCQIAVIIPDSATEKLFTLLNASPGDSALTAISPSDNLAGIVFLYDPAIQKVFKDAVIMPVNSLVQLTAVKVLMTKYTEDVNKTVKQHSSDFSSRLAGKDFFTGIPEFPYRKEVIKKFREELGNKTREGSEIQLPFSPSFSDEIVNITEESVRKDNLEFRPSVLQNNVPAFTLFAMFFIVIPLAGSIINEKNHGTFNRIRTLPVSYIEVVAAKVTVFLVVCVLQFVFLMYVGKYIMPLLGEQSSIDFGVNLPALLLALICSSLSAIGFGMIVGAFANTHGQAATFGSVMVVILALLGGIFVPVHMLPDVIKKISIISPLRWGTDAFLGVFARHQGVLGIWPEICLLTGFFIISMLLTVRVFKNH